VALTVAVLVLWATVVVVVVGGGGGGGAAAAEVTEQCSK